MSEFKKGRVSVVIPTFNRAGMVAECVESVLNQTYGDVEAIVVDDCGTDDTPAVMERLVGDRVKFVRQPTNLGGNAARNRGVSESAGEFLCFLDSDDLLRPRKVEAQLAHLAENPDADASVCQTRWFHDRPDDLPFVWNRLSDTGHLDGFLRLASPWSTTAPVWRRSSVLKVGGWKEGLPVAQDHEFHLRALCLGCEFVVLHRVLNDYREHSSAKVSSDASERYYGVQASNLEGAWKLLQGDPRFDESLQNRFATSYCYIACESTLLGRWDVARPYFRRALDVASGTRIRAGIRMAQCMAGVLPITKGRGRRKLYPLFGAFGLDLDGSVWWRRFKVASEES